MGGFEVADWVAKNDKISTVIMVSRGFWYFDQLHNFSIPEKTASNEKEDVFVEGVKNLIERFSNKKIIFVLENPTLALIRYYVTDKAI